MHQVGFLLHRFMRNFECMNTVHRGNVMGLKTNAIYRLLPHMTPGTMTLSLFDSSCANKKSGCELSH